MSFHAKYELKKALVCVYGQQTRISDDPSISYKQALALGATRGSISQLIVASGEGAQGHKLVLPFPRELEYADGLILNEVGQAGIFQVADCAAIFVYDHTTGKVAAGHGGRPAMTPPAEHRMCKGCTIVGNLLNYLNSPNVSAIEVLVTGNICGSCFVHKGADDEEQYLQWFRAIPGAVSEDVLGRLNLYRVIEQHFIHAGVPAENIRHVGPCSLETPGLSSHRRGDKTRNTFIVLKQS